MGEEGTGYQEATEMQVESKHMAVPLQTTLKPPNIPGKAPVLGWS